MPTFEVDSKPINAFRVGDAYLFKHFFPRDGVFGDLRQYYNGKAYRFEVPREAFDEVQSVLDEAFYGLEVVEDLDAFCVVKEKYTEHPDSLFRNAVAHRSRGQYTVFLLKDQLSVHQAVDRGARRLSETDIGVRF